MKSKIEINISVIDDGPVVMRCQGQNTSKGKALGEEAGEMTEIWAGICRLIRIQAYDVQIWLLERKKWLLDCRIGALDAQIWCCKKVIEITEAWE